MIVMMPELDGGLLAEQFKTSTPLEKVPIVFLTAPSNGKKCERARGGLVGFRSWLSLSLRAYQPFRLPSSPSQPYRLAALNGPDQQHVCRVHAVTSTAGELGGCGRAFERHERRRARSYQLARRLLRLA